MRLTLVRNATLIVELGERRLLVDPMLDDAGARPPIANTANQVPNPTVPLPFLAEQAVHGLDAVLVTHRHRDHLDARGEELTPRGIPVFCQPEDEDALLENRPRRTTGRERAHLGGHPDRSNARAPRIRSDRRGARAGERLPAR